MDVTRTFAKLQSIRFVKGPDARVSGNAATVTVVTIAENADTVTWRVAKEDGERKLDEITSIHKDIVSGSRIRKGL